ncbi:hypothetical protein Clacol_002176 [Clathrus columnatus]|uniref:Uncharacterized protein n=1 Tax=Clathrus columnatus TaxID=1419009 RepID=A0AAV5A3Y6_9AGAM|nr:hypothetical protein Clacol_002176 [Clathrus columnatus]
MTTSGEKQTIIIPAHKVGTKVKLQVQNVRGYSFSTLDIPKSVTLDSNDELTIVAIRDTQTSPYRNENPSNSEAEAQYSIYKVAALKQVMERYKAKSIYKIKHTELTNDSTVRRGEGTYSHIRLKKEEIAYLRTNISGYPKGTEVVVAAIGSKSGPGGNPSGHTAESSGSVTSATPITSIVYDVNVYLTRKTMVEYIPDKYLPHSHFRKA